MDDSTTRRAFAGLMGLGLLLAGCEKRTVVYAFDPVGPTQSMTAERADAACQSRAQAVQRLQDAAPAGSRLPGWHEAYEPCMTEAGWRRRVVSSRMNY